MKFSTQNIIIISVCSLSSLIILEQFVNPAENYLINVLFTSLKDFLELIYSAFTPFISSETASIWGIDNMYSFGVFTLEVLRIITCCLPGGALGIFISLCRCWKKYCDDSAPKYNRYR